MGPFWDKATRRRGRARRRASELAGVWHESLAASCFHLIYSLSLSNTMQPAKREREQRRMLSFLLLCLRNGRRKKREHFPLSLSYVFEVNRGRSQHWHRWRTSTGLVSSSSQLEACSDFPQTLNRRMHAFKKENRSAYFCQTEKKILFSTLLLLARPETDEYFRTGNLALMHTQVAAGFLRTWKISLFPA